MKKRNFNLFFHDILESINKIEKYTQDIDFENFIDNTMVIDAVTRNFEIMGEAVKYLPADIRNKFPEIPFKKIAGMRDKIIHGYFGINYKYVWTAIKDDLPILKPQIETALRLLEKFDNE
ncbi:MAG: hypothetical protein A2104_04085 [Candidatus Melainabacteria bacterium GWF2_32_7]|nr:MAG: hypothetical protein A2104_04085 [Candidatus Melainabacteria bacterium GWF2_32_7]